ncbi:MAG: hypothetical protein VX520_09530 [Planctomycetota bacterium]|nr:hypothetical protein [Planctomycetota bacterium]MEC9189442.1 hypothetical protein [Planctomycetota bacterium]
MLSHRNRSFEDVAKFSCIAWPVIVKKFGGGFCNAYYCLARFFGKLL